ncbi:MAG: hypothetical protein ACXW32_08135 [Limisphaerales bacterium]
MFAKLFGKGSSETGRTFKERVENFWGWFPTVSERLAAELKAKKTSAIADEVSAAVDRLGPGFAWEVGPDGDKDSLTLSGEGNLHRQLLTQYWLQRAPVIPGWNFYSARQADATRRLELVIEGKTFFGAQIWVSPTLDKEDEKFDLALWHPEWERLDEKQRWTMLFIFLDTQLGEYGTQRWIGRIEFSEVQLKEAMALDELPEFIAKTSEQEGWENRAPGESTTVYQLEPHDRFARGDVVFGSTMHLPLVNDYLNAEGKLEDPLAGTGADYVYLALGIEHLPKGEEVAARARFEDALDEQLRAEGLGRLLGGATGSRFGYIDLLIFDGERSVTAIEQVLKGMKVGMHLNYFAKEKRKLGRKID